MPDIIIVAGYLILLVGMGLYGGRNIRSATDFAASGRRYGSWVIFASLSASYVGGGFSAGNAAEAFDSGIGTTVALFGFSLAMVLIGRYLVPGVERLRGVTTVGGVIETAYGMPARRTAGVFTFLCCAGVVAAQLHTMGTVFHILLGIPPWQGTLAGCAIVLVYTTYGGMQSVITADMIQFILLAAGMPILLIMGLRQAGGVAAVAEAMPVEYWNPLYGRSLTGFVSLFIMMAAGEALAPPYTQRLLIGAGAKQTAHGTIWSGWFSVPFFMVTGMIGLTAYALQLAVEPAFAMPAMIAAVLPVGLRGLVMAAMVSIMLSAADGFLHSAAVGLVCDTILPARPDMSPCRQLKTLRWVNAATALAALTLAFWIPDVFSLLVFGYSFWGALLLVPLAAVFLGTRVRRHTFRYGVLAALAAAVVWEVLLRRPLDIDGAVVGMAANAAVFIARKI